MIEIRLNSREAVRVAKALERGINMFDSNSRDEKTVPEALALALKRIQDELHFFSLDKYIPLAQRTKRITTEPEL
jgi:hypothetical protein